MIEKLEVWLDEEPNTVSIQLSQPFFNSLKVVFAIVLGKKIVFKAKKVVWNTGNLPEVVR